MPKVRFLDTRGRLLAEADVQPGERLLDVAQAHDVALEGACEGSMACSTCHVILQGRDFGQFKPPSEEEEDMLDFAYGVTSTSRLSCQLWLPDTVESLDVSVPANSRNLLRS